MIADRGYDTEWFGGLLKDKGVRACIAGRKSRSRPIKRDRRR